MEAKCVACGVEGRAPKQSVFKDEGWTKDKKGWLCPTCNSVKTEE